MRHSLAEHPDPGAVMCHNERMLFDLSHPIHPGMPGYPGDPEVRFGPGLELAVDGANVATLQLGTHTGTHLDAPAHVVAGGRTVDQLEPHLLHGAAYVAGLRGPARAGQLLELADLVELPAQLPAIVCLATGWDQHFMYPSRRDHPAVSLALAETLCERGARVLGVDTLSPDPTGDHAAGLPVHEFWLGHDGVIVENLRGLTGLPARVGMSLLPLALAGLDGSPLRAVAWEL